MNTGRWAKLMDAWGFAPHQETYEIFEQGVRKEYRLVPAFIYRKKRAAVLRGFMERSQIYTSGIFPEARERQARENLSNAVSQLEGRA